MAVVLITNVKDFVGVSGDTKPTGAPAGSTFYETNTRTRHIYDGTAWQQRIDE